MAQSRGYVKMFFFSNFNGFIFLSIYTRYSYVRGGRRKWGEEMSHTDHAVIHYFHCTHVSLIWSTINKSVVHYTSLLTLFKEKYCLWNWTELMIALRILYWRYKRPTSKAIDLYNFCVNMHMLQMMAVLLFLCFCQDTKWMHYKLFLCIVYIMFVSIIRKDISK